MPITMNTEWKNFLNEKELSAVGIVVCLDEKSRFLIIRRSDIDEREGQWTIPGGHIDDEDDFEEDEEDIDEEEDK